MGYAYKSFLFMDEKRIIEYIQGNYIPENELIEILDWIEYSEENQKKYNELKKLWVITGLSNVNRMGTKRFFTVPDKTKTFNIQAVKQLIKYAAVIVLAFITGAFSFYLINKSNTSPFAEVFNEIYVPNGEKSMVTLYDGTEVWLNSGTTFRYPVVFNKNTRNVFIDGEAFFNVAKSKEIPFYVNAGDMHVKVLGTSFNVYAYQDENVLHATLEEGSVSISVTGSKKNISLSPGEQISYYTETREYELSGVDVGLFTSWKENMLRFENAELAEILKKMERWYDVKMKIDENFDTSPRYTITIKTESLREMLDVLSLTTQMNYEIKNNEVKIVKN